jgi:hypothetical protein
METYAGSPISSQRLQKKDCLALLMAAASLFCDSRWNT